MVKIKPIKVEADLKYRCPDCNGENWLTLSEAKAYRKFVCLMCGQSTPLTPLCGITLHYGHVKETATSPAHPTLAKVSDISQFVATLVNLGYKQAQAKALVEVGVAEGRWTGNDSDFLSYLCSQRKTG